MDNATGAISTFTLSWDASFNLHVINSTGGGSSSSSAAAATNESEINELIPLRNALLVVIPMTVIYSTILLAGLLGNTITCIVIYKISYMHTSTNYYLFSLAVSDILLLVCGLPQEMYLIWFRYPYVFGEPFCILRGILSETSTNATVLTLTAFTVERYVAVCHPLKTHKLSKLSRVIRAIVVIWIASFVLAIPQAVQFGVVDEVLPNGLIIHGAWCSIKMEIPYAFEISICVFFIIPMAVITVLYALIGFNLRKTPISIHGDRDSGRNSSAAHAAPAAAAELTSTETRFPLYRPQSHVIRMLVAVVVAFFVSYAPFHCQRILAIYASGTTSKTLVSIYDFITHISGILYYSATSINPILYQIMSNKFRQAFKDTLSYYCGRNSAQRRGRGRNSELGRITFRNQRGHIQFCRICRSSTFRSSSTRCPYHPPGENNHHSAPAAVQMPMTYIRS